MNKRFIKQIENKYKNTPTDELEELYYNKVSHCGGSDYERMYELGYDISEIIEQELQDNLEVDELDVIEDILCKRGVKLWK